MGLTAPYLLEADASHSLTRSPVCKKTLYEEDSNHGHIKKSGSYGFPSVRNIEFRYGSGLRDAGGRPQCRCDGGRVKSYRSGALASLAPLASVAQVASLAPLASLLLSVVRRLNFMEPGYWPGSSFCAPGEVIAHVARRPVILKRAPSLRRTTRRQ